MRSPLNLYAAVLLVAVSGVSADLRAQSGPQASAPPSRQDAAPPPANRTSLSDSVRRAQRETGGQVLGAERVQFDGREINRVKVMDDRGRVRYMDDDPQRLRNREQEGRRRGDFEDRRGSEREEAEPRARRDHPRRP